MTKDTILNIIYNTLFVSVFIWIIICVMYPIKLETITDIITITPMQHILIIVIGGVWLNILWLLTIVVEKKMKD